MTATRTAISVGGSGCGRWSAVWFHCTCFTLLLGVSDALWISSSTNVNHNALGFSSVVPLSMIDPRRSRRTGRGMAVDDEDEAPHEAPPSRSAGTESGRVAVSGVTLKLAFDANGCVADLAAERSERFTSAESLDMVHRLRRVSDAVLVGKRTVEADDCSLTVRRVPLLPDRGQPARVVVDPDLTLLDSPSSAYALFTDGVAPTLVYHTTKGRNPSHAQALVVNETDGKDFVELVDLSSSTSSSRPPHRSSTHHGGGTISPRAVVDDLKTRHLCHLMVEGGPYTARTFLDERMVDRAILVRAPVAFRQGLPSDLSSSDLERAGLQTIGVYHLGGDAVECWTRDGVDWPLEGGIEAWP